MNMIEARGGLTKVYGDTVAVDGLNLAVKKGTIFGFLGPNGAGKTTTILMFLGLIQPTKGGEAYVNGINVQENPVEVKRISGYMPGEGSLYPPNMSALDNLLYFAKFYRMPKSEAEKRARELLELVGLKDVADKKVGSFSTGMKQRLLLAQALINDPLVLFLDEPTNGLDPRGVVELRDVLRDLKKDGKTILFSSHILSEVEIISDEIGIISKGKLLISGSQDEIKRKFIEGRYMIVAETVEPIDVGSLDLDAADLRLEGQNRLVVYSERDIRVELLRMLESAGYTVLDVHLQEPTLEDVFMELVYGGEESMIGAIAEKEFRDNLTSKRFFVVFGFLLAVVVLSLILVKLDLYGMYMPGGDDEAPKVYHVLWGVNYLIGSVGGIFALALGFDAVTKEKENRTMNVLMGGHPVFRDQVILGGKILGGGYNAGGLRPHNCPHNDRASPVDRRYYRQLR
ncbi:ATP-binding cassette domain-containing protein [Thermococcus sp. JCM 11816]|uniref:ATP-binding cassette domain-containing protein n=1 Tax=Thermococcus sp. (strain JCM 11816 / KS-1) TaxID=1295125 RepID=UPI000B1997C7